MPSFLICTLTDYLQTLEKRCALSDNTDKYSQERQLLLSADYWDKSLGGFCDYHYLSHLLQNIHLDQIILYLMVILNYIVHLIYSTIQFFINSKKFYIIIIF